MEKSILVSFDNLKAELEEFSKTIKKPTELIPLMTSFLGQYLDLKSFNIDVTSEIYKTKVAHNLSEIRGLISKDKLPTYKLDDRDKTVGVELVIPKVEIDIEGLDQCEYLLCRCYYLLYIYNRYCWYELEVKDNRHREGKLPDGVVLEQITKELWVAINAICIRKRYENCAKEADITRSLSGFISEVLIAYQNTFKTMRVLDEIIFPIGSKHHAMYLALEKIDEKMVLLRIDDLALTNKKYHQPLVNFASNNIPPYVVDILPIDNLIEHRDYLVTLCQVKLVDKDNNYIVKFELPKLYTHGQQKLKEITITGFPAYEIMTMGNCVVKNYSVGARLRNDSLINPGEVFYDWLFDQEKEYLNKNTLFEEAIKERNKKMKGFERQPGLSIPIVTLTDTHEFYILTSGTKLQYKKGMEGVLEKVLANPREISDKKIEATRTLLKDDNEDANESRKAAYDANRHFHRKKKVEITDVYVDATQFSDGPSTEINNEGSPKSVPQKAPITQTSPTQINQEEKNQKLHQRSCWEVSREYIPHSAFIMGAIIYNSNILPTYFSILLMTGGALSTSTGRHVLSNINNYFFSNATSENINNKDETALNDGKSKKL